MGLSEIYKISLITFPSVLKQQLSFDIKKSQKDYLSRESNIHKYVYNACDGIQYCGVSYMKYKRELKELDNKALNDGVVEVVGRNFEVEARLSLRRIMELFVEVRNFRIINNTEREQLIRQYYLIRALQAYHQKHQFIKTYAELNSEYLNIRVEEIIREIGDPTPAFYLKTSTAKIEKRKIRKLLKSFRSLLDEMLPQTNEAEKIILGESYQQYAETSNVIHGYLGLAKFNLDNYHEELEGIYAKMHIFAICILKDLIEIGREFIKDKNVIESVEGLKSDLPELFKVSVGDVVAVKKQIKAKVIDIKESKYGIKKYKVEYIEKKGDFLLSFEEDEFLLKDIRKVEMN